jgi:hypothetical protein
MPAGRPQQQVRRHQASDRIEGENHAPIVVGRRRHEHVEALAAPFPLDAQRLAAAQQRSDRVHDLAPRATAKIQVSDAEHAIADPNGRLGCVQTMDQRIA